MKPSSSSIIVTVNLTYHVVKFDIYLNQKSKNR